MPSVFENLKENFKRLASSGQLSHAYLFFGGNKEIHQEKFIFAQSLANFLENGTFEEPKKLLRETLIISPDEKGTIGIDNIRIVRFYLSQKPITSSRRVVIVKEAGNLTPEAQNAALKITEEPPEESLIIFISETIEDLFSTLASRLQRIHFSSAARINNDKKRISADEDDIEQLFEDLIANLKADPIKNSKKLKEALSRLALIKQFNTNKKLQWRSLDF